jgi:hypothetical protein
MGKRYSQCENIFLLAVVLPTGAALKFAPDQVNSRRCHHVFNNIDGSQLWFHVYPEVHVLPAVLALNMHM